jgi:predicted outer membrane repeat protein
VGGEVQVGGDCDDAEDWVNPGMAETCDGIDQDCDGEIDDDAADARTWYLDLDDDGFGAIWMGSGCSRPPRTVDEPGDCNDSDGTVHPRAIEAICDGRDSNCDGYGEGAVAAYASSLPGDKEYLSVQAAIDASPAGGLVRLCPGEWTESVTWEKNLTLRGDPKVPSVLRARPGEPVVVATAPTVRLFDLTFRGGYSASQGGNARIQADLLVVENVVFAEGVAATQGGGLAWRGTGPTPKMEMVDVTFSGNEAGESGGGLAVGAVKRWETEFDRVTFVDNVAGQDGGGALFLGENEDDLVYMTNTWFTGNRAGRDGGGLAITSGQAGKLTVADCGWSGNVAGKKGGALATAGAGSIRGTLARAELTGNEAPRGAALAVSNDSDDVWNFEESAIEANRGGAALEMGSAGSTSLQMELGTVTRNTTGILRTGDARGWLSIKDVDLGTAAQDNTVLDALWGMVRVERDGISSLFCNSSGCR